MCRAGLITVRIDRDSRVGHVCVSLAVAVPTCDHSGLPPGSIHVGFRGVFRNGESVAIDKVFDGSSNVVLMGESMGFIDVLPGFGFQNIRHSSVTGGAAIMRPDLFGQMLELFSTPAFGQEIQFGAAHAGVVNFAYCDGSVSTISRSVTPTTLMQVGGREDGNIVNTDEL